MHSDPILTNEIVTTLAKETGFDLIGFAKADQLTAEIEKLDEWLGNGFQAGMGYMEKNKASRLNPKEFFPELKSVISLALIYNSGHSHATGEDEGKISRYAWGKDYHLVAWEMLDTLCKKLQSIDPGFSYKYYIDTGPVMDKVWAVRAGIGWMGKHSNIINRDVGSWFFIASIFCNRIFEYSSPVSDLCGTCTACIDACPTGAIVKDYIIDSNLCISYHTIENKKEIPADLEGKFEKWVFGCDICQDVCPWNKKFGAVTNHPDFFPAESKTSVNLSELIEMTNSVFKKKYRYSPLMRPGLKGMKRNAEFLRRKTTSDSQDHKKK